MLHFFPLLQMKHVRTCTLREVIYLRFVVFKIELLKLKKKIIILLCKILSFQKYLCNELQGG